MISDIYILKMTLYKPFKNEGPFYDFIESNFPATIKDHLPEYITFKSIEYKQDEVVTSLLNHFISRMEIVNLNDLLQKMHLELGYLHLRLESEEDLCRKELPSVEFVLKKLHEEYSFITSYFFYLKNSMLQSFVKMWTFRSDHEEEEEGDKLEGVEDYTELIDSYLYRGEIPEEYQAEIARMMLLQV